jgi:Mn2+/Fe2+ NRAMP family transporter
MPQPTVKEESSGQSAAARNRTDFLLCLGPGLIIRAADDDPSRIAIYSQVGAQSGTGVLWTMLFSFPLLIGAYRFPDDNELIALDALEPILFGKGRD